MPILSGTLGAGFFGKARGKRFCSLAIASTTGSTVLPAPAEGAGCLLRGGLAPLPAFAGLVGLADFSAFAALSAFACSASCFFSAASCSKPIVSCHVTRGGDCSRPRSDAAPHAPNPAGAVRQGP